MTLNPLKRLGVKLYAAFGVGTAIGGFTHDVLKMTKDKDRRPILYSREQASDVIRHRVQFSAVKSIFAGLVWPFDLSTSLVALGVQHTRLRASRSRQRAATTLQIDPYEQH